VDPIDKEFFAVGIVVKAFGIKGDVVVKPMTDDPARFLKLTFLWVGANSDLAVKTRIEHASVDPRGVRLKLEGIQDRTAAEKIRGKLLFVDRIHRVSLPDGRHFLHDVIGLTVRDDTGAELGAVADVLRFPANDVYVVRGTKGEIMIPAVKEFITAIDMASRTMTVHLIEGMLT
jgi:16S rRNA processing protein RimM